MKSLQCQLCKNGATRPGNVTVTLQRGPTMVIIKAVPAEICENCGEYYLDEKTTEQVLSMAEEAVKNHAEVEILSFAA
jgi:YgiT-type zinc finger domain-containing protein